MPDSEVGQAILTLQLEITHSDNDDTTERKAYDKRNACKMHLRHDRAHVNAELAVFVLRLLQNFHLRRPGKTSWHRPNLDSMLQ